MGVPRLNLRAKVSGVLVLAVVAAGVLPAVVAQGSPLSDKQAQARALEASIQANGSKMVALSEKLDELTRARQGEWKLTEYWSNFPDLMWNSGDDCGYGGLEVDPFRMVFYIENRWIEPQAVELAFTSLPSTSTCAAIKSELQRSLDEAMLASNSTL